jgi:hypothetical protein
MFWLMRKKFFGSCLALIRCSRRWLGHTRRQRGRSPQQAIDNLSTVFEQKSDCAPKTRDAEVEKLHAKIGRLVVERDFLAKAFGR